LTPRVAAGLPLARVHERSLSRHGNVRKPTNSKRRRPDLLDVRSAILPADLRSSRSFATGARSKFRQRSIAILVERMRCNRRCLDGVPQFRKPKQKD